MSLADGVYHADYSRPGSWNILVYILHAMKMKMNCLPASWGPLSLTEVTLFMLVHPIDKLGAKLWIKPNIPPDINNGLYFTGVLYHTLSKPLEGKEPGPSWENIGQETSKFYGDSSDRWGRMSPRIPGRGKKGAKSSFERRRRAEFLGGVSILVNRSSSG